MTRRSLGRKSDIRRQLLRNLAISVILYESVKTTAAKAKSVAPIIDRLIRLAQRQDSLTANRTLRAILNHEKAAIKIQRELVSRYGQQTSGFVRLVSIPRRLGDRAAMMVIQLTRNIDALSEPVSPSPAALAKPVASAEKLKAR